MDAISKEVRGVFFVYVYKGIVKTFLWHALLASFCSNGQMVLTVVSSGIASLLLLSERIAHLRFGIPLDINEGLS